METETPLSHIPPPASSRNSVVQILAGVGFVESSAACAFPLPRLGGRDAFANSRSLDSLLSKLKIRWRQGAEVDPQRAEEEYDYEREKRVWRTPDELQLAGAFEEVIPKKLWEEWEEMERGRDALRLSKSVGETWEIPSNVG